MSFLMPDANAEQRMDKKNVTDSSWRVRFLLDLQDGGWFGDGTDRPYSWSGVCRGQSDNGDVRLS